VARPRLNTNLRNPRVSFPEHSRFPSFPELPGPVPPTSLSVESKPPHLSPEAPGRSIVPVPNRPRT